MPEVAWIVKSVHELLVNGGEIRRKLMRGSSLLSFNVCCDCPSFSFVQELHYRPGLWDWGLKNFFAQEVWRHRLSWGTTRKQTALFFLLRENSNYLFESLIIQPIFEPHRYVPVPENNRGRVSIDYRRVSVRYTSSMFCFKCQNEGSFS